MKLAAKFCSVCEFELPPQSLRQNHDEEIGHYTPSVDRFHIGCHSRYNGHECTFRVGESGRRSARRSKEFSRPLAQNHVLVAVTPSHDKIVDDPGFVILPEWPSYRHLDISRDCRGSQMGRQRTIFSLLVAWMLVKTWERLPPQEFTVGMPFVHEGLLYVMATLRTGKILSSLAQKTKENLGAADHISPKASFGVLPPAAQSRRGSFTRAFVSPANPMTLCRRKVCGMEFPQSPGI